MSRLMPREVSEEQTKRNLSERDKLEQLAEKFFQDGEDWMLSKRGREQ